MTTKTNIRVLGLAALVGIGAGFTVPTAFAYSDEVTISAPATTTNIFLCGPDDLGFGMYPDWIDPAYGKPGLTPHEEAKLKSELAALDAAYESLFDKFYHEAIPSEEEQAEFDAQLSVLDEEYDAVLAKISAALLGDEDADAEPLFETLVEIDAKYEQLFDKFYPEVILSEAEQADFDAGFGHWTWCTTAYWRSMALSPNSSGLSRTVSTWMPHRGPTRNGTTGTRMTTVRKNPPDSRSSRAPDRAAS